MESEIPSQSGDDETIADSLQDPDDLDQLLTTSGVQDPAQFGMALKNIIQNKIQAVLSRQQEDKEKMETAKEIDSGECTVEKADAAVQSEKHWSNSSVESTMSVNTSLELQELELLQKSLDSQIASLKVSPVSASEAGPVLGVGLSRPCFVPIMQKVAERTVSASGPCSTLSAPLSRSAILSGGVNKTEAEHVKWLVTETVWKECNARPGSTATTSSAPTTAGRLTGLDDQISMRIMQLLKDVDGKNSLHFHVEGEILEQIAQGHYVDFANLLKDEVDDAEGLQVVNQNNLMFYIPATKPPNKIENYEIWSQAFLVFQSAFQVYFPEKAGQLLEYRSYIERISHVFDWGRVYDYDKHFRCVQADNPHSLWGLVNQDAKEKHLLRVKGSDKKP